MDLKVDTKDDKKRLYNELWNFIGVHTPCPISAIHAAFYGKVTQNGVPIKNESFRNYLSTLVRQGRIHGEKLPGVEMVYYTEAGWKEHERQLQLQRREREKRERAEKRAQREAKRALKGQAQQTLNLTPIAPAQLPSLVDTHTVKASQAMETFTELLIGTTEALRGLRSIVDSLTEELGRAGSVPVTRDQVQNGYKTSRLGDLEATSGSDVNAKPNQS